MGDVDGAGDHDDEEIHGVNELSESFHFAPCSGPAFMKVGCLK